MIRILNAQGKHAFIGIAFNERNDAFDFNVRQCYYFIFIECM